MSTRNILTTLTEEHQILRGLFAQMDETTRFGGKNAPGVTQ